MTGDVTRCQSKILQNLLPGPLSEEPMPDTEDEDLWPGPGKPDEQPFPQTSGNQIVLNTHDHLVFLGQPNQLGAEWNAPSRIRHRARHPLRGKLFRHPESNSRELSIPHDQDAGIGVQAKQIDRPSPRHAIAGISLGRRSFEYRNTVGTSWTVTARSSAATSRGWSLGAAISMVGTSPSIERSHTPL